MLAPDFKRYPSRRVFIIGAAATSLGLPHAASAQTGKAAVSRATIGVGPAVFFRERLGLEMHPAEGPVTVRESEAMRQLAMLGYGQRIGRWSIVRAGPSGSVHGTLLGAQYGIASAERAPMDYSDYDLHTPTVTAFVTADTDDDHAAILRHRHWDALHMFAPIAPMRALADMLLPVRAKQSIRSWDMRQLFEKGVTEYFSKLGEVNIQAVETFRRLRLRNVHGQPIYDKHNA